ncbi:hypothetical protein CYLTODRAFT_212522 [Cylindrobasidium torrendii FP15055 ss-10]|uniref:Uncharacterized protein n=1 Tax=Cylindrobasidium torrendii FP15055 ss-10 TaxID=1314674 RepID=A0A0D7BH29_9AGAR|nr:hypothetical protein CYLTODRAFT_212522 [Cylindrobasidium torrendii FP15055 ss-10]
MKPQAAASRIIQSPFNVISGSALLPGVMWITNNFALLTATSNVQKHYCELARMCEVASS